MAKADWPIDVNARDVAARTRNSIQLPVLERQGLVSAKDGYVDWRDDENQAVERVSTRRYELTAAGREAMKPAKNGKPDLCAGRLEVDRIVSVSGTDEGRASVHFQYRFKAEPWVQSDEVRRVFPMVDALLQGEGRMEMQQGFHVEGAAWVADSSVEGAR